jgi:hypothetical protein
MCAVTLHVASAAHATVITRTFNLASSNYGFGVGNPEPRPEPLAMNVTITLDTSISVGNSTSGLTVNSFNLPYGVTYGYNHENTILSLGANTTIGGCGGPYCLFIFGAFEQSPNFFSSSQTTSTGGFWVAATNTINYTDGTAAVPEPASWALLLTGFGAVGAALRRRRGLVTASA